MKRTIQLLISLFLLSAVMIVTIGIITTSISSIAKAFTLACQLNGCAFMIGGVHMLVITRRQRNQRSYKIIWPLMVIFLGIVLFYMPSILIAESGPYG